MYLSLISIAVCIFTHIHPYELKETYQIYLQWLSLGDGTKVDLKFLVS